MRPFTVGRCRVIPQIIQILHGNTVSHAAIAWRRAGARPRKGVRNYLGLIAAICAFGLDGATASHFLHPVGLKLAAIIVQRVQGLAVKVIVAASAVGAAAVLGLGFVFGPMLMSSSESATAAVSKPVPTISAPATGAVQVAQANVPAKLPISSDASSNPFFSSAFPPGAANPNPVAMLGPSAPPPVEASAPKGPAAYRQANVDGPYIALTFDDGPSPETTPKLLKILEERHIKATFFMLGQNVAANPEVVRAVAAGGNEIGSHSWNHPQLPKIPVAAADKQLEDTSDAIFNVTGRRPIYLRPPYGAMTKSLEAHIEQKYGLSLIFWSVDPLDWKIRDSQSVYDQIMKQVRPGAIILSHDIHPTTVAAMPRVIDTLLAKGYKFVTVSELIAMNKPAPPKPVAAAAPPGAVQQRKKPKQTAQNTPAGQAKPAVATRPAPAPSPASATVPGEPMTIRPGGTVGIY
ncbi:polysaccharide deacetylase family protein [Azorhizobium caulinodans ORS 571]|uniref:Chitooligosaccharide deacetylase n=2 Tax=Azorhizobium caulinodans TaxID=7 RepID=A8I8U8_AZOC5|nr:polysaccharide deacetylase family protein [Azorhizobium caulinodans ORS 571]